MFKTEARIGCERDNQQPAVPLVLVVPSVSQKAADSQSPIITILFRIAPLGLKHEEYNHAGELVLIFSLQNLALCRLV